MIISVAQLNRYVCFLLRDNEMLRGISVRGEISNFTRNSRSGHCYFTLKARDSAVKAVMFAQNAARLDFEASDGMTVVADGNAALYERDGSFQIVVTALRHDGEGELLAAFEALRRRLSDEGIFDEAHKKALPRFPRKIGVAASASGAALKDVINVLSRRYPLGELIVFPTAVQGTEAPSSVCSSIAIAQRSGCDVLIIARGGGSFEDLNCFNSEAIARAVFDCEIPVVSAIGHETDFTICDFAADLRAPTPSAAAELCAPDCAALYSGLDNYLAALKTAGQSSLTRPGFMLKALDGRLSMYNPSARLSGYVDKSEMQSRLLADKINAQIERREVRLAHDAALLESYSPLGILARGYAIASDASGAIIRDAGAVECGDKISILLRNGKIAATVEFCD